MELILGILLGAGICYGSLFVRDYLNARELARWQEWREKQVATQPEERKPAVPKRANPKAEQLVQPRKESTPQPQPQPEVEEDDDELARLASLVDEED